jgi:hypothetical protein
VVVCFRHGKVGTFFRASLPGDPPLPKSIREIEGKAWEGHSLPWMTR